MLKRMGLKAVVVNVMLAYFSMAWASMQYGEILCKDPLYRCLKIKRGDSWARLFKDEQQRDLVKRVNRMNAFLKPGMIIAVPLQLSKISLLDVSPFPRNIQSRGEKSLVIDRAQLAFAAYDEDGHLVKWGPASVGTSHCPDIAGGCITPAGEFRVLRKQGVNCVSSVFPRRLNGVNGGAAMPYCIHFYRGYALHSGDELTGLASTHGCVNLFLDDAQWLNQQFVNIPGQGRKGTLIVIY